ncbi:hypothetical protein [Brevundimonas sp.]|uniref:hypothetical protein n=1 Tax=Brevundimonas sp. TaxID=1871086 RepID=UPI002FC9304F
MQFPRYGAVAAAALAMALPASADAQMRFGRGRPATPTVINEVPRCTQNLGTITIADTQNELFGQMGLGTPGEVLRHLVRESGCFRLIERGPGMDVIERERGLGAAGRIRTADFVLIAELGNNIEADGEDRSRGLMGALASTGGRMLMQAGVSALTGEGGIPGFSGGGGGGMDNAQLNQMLSRGANMLQGQQAAPALNSRTVDALSDLKKDIGKGKEDAQIIMSIASVPLAETVGSTRSIANENELRRLRIRDNQFGGRVGAGYESEDEGKVIALALVRAYSDLVTTLGGTGSDTPEVVIANREAVAASEADRRNEESRAQRAEQAERDRAEQRRRAEEDRIRDEIRREERARYESDRADSDRSDYRRDNDYRDSDRGNSRDSNNRDSRAMTSRPSSSVTQITVSRNSVLRDSPSGDPLQAVEPGDNLFATGRKQGAWLEVELTDGSLGWVQEDRVSSKN